MIKLSDEAKNFYAKYVGPDGKLVIDDSLPNDLKETFQYFNDKGINILEMNVDDSSVNSDDDIEVLEGSDSDDDIDDGSFSYDDSYSESQNVNIVEDDSQVDLDSLNDMFS